jgi:hypothetical protein
MAHWNDKTTSLPKPRSTHPLPTFLYAKNPYPISQKLSLSLGVGCSYSLLPVGYPWTFCTWMYGMQVLQEQKPAPTLSSWAPLSREQLHPTCPPNNGDILLVIHFVLSGSLRRVSGG